nr:MAG TPA: hypothetical protein [Caudoviricetes sp.]
MSLLSIYLSKKQCYKIYLKKSKLSNPLRGAIETIAFFFCRNERIL